MKHRVLLKVLGGLVLALVLGGCTSPSGPAHESGSPSTDEMRGYLYRYEWTLIQLEGTSVATEGAPTLRFIPDDAVSGRIGGLAGVNRYVGTFGFEGATLALRIEATTRMMGLPAAMDMEKTMMGWMDGSPREWDLADQVLNLYQEGTLVMRWGRGPAVTDSP